jgi:hypothetical protein
MFSRDLTPVIPPTDQYPWSYFFSITLKTCVGRADTLFFLVNTWINIVFNFIQSFRWVRVGSSFKKYKKQNSNMATCRDWISLVLWRVAILNAKMNSGRCILATWHWFDHQRTITYWVTIQSPARQPCLYSVFCPGFLYFKITPTSPSNFVYT